MKISCNEFYHLILVQIDFIGVTTGTTTQKDFNEYNNIKIVDNLSDILEVI